MKPRSSLPRPASGTLARGPTEGATVSAEALPTLSELRRRPWMKWPNRFFVAFGVVLVAFGLVHLRTERRYFIAFGAFMAVSSLADALNLGKRWTVALLGLSWLLLLLSFVALLGTS